MEKSVTNTTSTTPSATAGDVILEAHNISVDYEAENGTVHAVNDVSFTLRRGEILGLAGESGSGKSTLAYAIARLLRPPAIITGGTAMYYPRLRPDDTSRQRDRHALPPDEPVDILKLSREQLRSLRWDELSIVFQSAMNALNPVMTIGDQIEDVLRTHRPQMGPDSRKRRIQELLELVNIAPDRQRSYPHELSGGMRQRAIIAIALALSPEIVILDEPTTALDVVVQREILAEMMRLRKELHFAIIFITHDLSLLLEVADHVAIMYAGHIIEKATGDEIYHHPRHPYSYGLLHSFPSLTGPRRKMRGIPGSPPDLRNIPSGCPFHPRCPLVFSVCPTEFPLLQPAPRGDGAGQEIVQGETVQVACHLYNPQHRPVPPPQSELARAYEQLGEKEERPIR